MASAQSALHPETWPHLNCRLIVESLLQDSSFRPEHLQLNDLAFRTLWRNILLSLIVFFRGLMQFELMDDPHILVLVDNPDMIDVTDADEAKESEFADQNTNCLKKRILRQIMFLLNLEINDDNAGQALLDACNTIAKAKSDMSTWPDKYQYFITRLRLWRENELDDNDDSDDYDDDDLTNYIEDEDRYSVLLFNRFRKGCKKAGIAPFGLLYASDQFLINYMSAYKPDGMQVKLNRDLPRLVEILSPSGEYQHIDLLRLFRRNRQLPIGEFVYQIEVPRRQPPPAPLLQAINDAVTTDVAMNCNELYARLLSIASFSSLYNSSRLFDVFKRRVLKTLLTYLAHLTSLETYGQFFSLQEEVHKIKEGDGVRVIQGQPIAHDLIDVMTLVTTYELHTSHVDLKLEDACDVIRDVHRKMAQMHDKHVRFSDLLRTFQGYRMGWGGGYRRRERSESSPSIRDFRNACKQSGIAPFFLLESPDAHMLELIHQFDDYRNPDDHDDDAYLNKISFSRQTLLPIWNPYEEIKI